MTAKIVSIGYERRSFDELLKELRKHKVTRLVDVRELPLSRRKGFSKGALSASLEENGIQYEHIRVAGNPYRKDYDDIEPCLKRYARHLKQNPSIVESVTAEFSGATCAILCYERDHTHCHRSVLIDAIKQKDNQIHLVIA
jgi:uncharacterized protein (DUF488 family)